MDPTASSNHTASRRSATKSPTPAVVKPAAGPVANGTANGYKTGDRIFKEQKPVKVDDDTNPRASSLRSHADRAHEELAGKSMAQIEHATALTWGGRALASYELSLASEGEKLRWYCDGEAFRQEALEHAAMAEDAGALLINLEIQLQPARTAAWDSLQGAAAARA